MYEVRGTELHQSELVKTALLPGPSISLLLGLSLFGVLASAGCTNRQGAPSPFLTADRVPPPSTRALPPGAAQPYYQGDPLPVMQGGASVTPSAFPAGPQALAATSFPANPPAQSTLAPTLPVSQPVMSRPRVTQASYTEAAIAVPSDDSALRFAPATTFAPQPTFVAQAAPATAEANRAVAIPTSQPFAAERAPVGVTLTPTSATAPIFSAEVPSADGLPWVSGSAPRGPVIVASNSAPRPTSSQLVPVAAPAPRVRLPGYPAPQQTFVTPAAGGSPTGQVRITELPTGPAYLPTQSATQPPASDGFRSRSSDPSLQRL